MGGWKPSLVSWDFPIAQIMQGKYGPEEGTRAELFLPFWGQPEYPGP